MLADAVNLLIPTSVAIAVGVAHLFKGWSHYIHTKEWSWNKLLWDTGGMPSGHSALVSALATSVLLVEGLSTIFWVSLFLMLIVVRDAFGVRQSVGEQARLINVLLGHAKLEKKVKIVLGHTPLQDGVGVLVGISTSIVVWTVWPF